MRRDRGREHGVEDLGPEHGETAGHYRQDQDRLLRAELLARRPRRPRRLRRRCRRHVCYTLVPDFISKCSSR